MSICHRCSVQMFNRGNRMECPLCGYSYEVPSKLPTYDELKKEIYLLKLYLKDNELEANYNAWKTQL